jgi:hypothetical protein
MLLQPKRLVGYYCSDTRDIERACIMTERRNVLCDGRGSHRQTLDVNVNIPHLNVLNQRFFIQPTTSLTTHSCY